MTKSNLLEIPGIGKTFVKDFARINIHSISDLVDQDADQLFLDLCHANEMVEHKTSKNYLYVIRMPFTMRTVGRTAPSFSGMPGKTSQNELASPGNHRSRSVTAATDCTARCASVMSTLTTA